MLRNLPVQSCLWKILFLKRYLYVLITKWFNLGLLQIFKNLISMTANKIVDGSIKWYHQKGA
jgi:hypothetical protein